MEDAQGSEVARLLKQIREEYESAVQAVSGLACGATQHRVINQKMRRMSLWQDELENLVGAAATVSLVDQQIRTCSSVNSTPV
jgi:hypothetical protein